MPPTLDNFHAIRERQCRAFGRDYTATDRQASETLFDTARVALRDIAKGDRSISFRVCSMPTGYGKSTSAVAFMVAAAAADPEFSAVYVCKERKFAEDIGNMIDALARDVIGSPLALVYTTAHSDRADRVKERERFLEKYNGFVPKRPLVERDNLRNARITVVTHKSWLLEIERDDDSGVRFFRGKRRLAFVDEQPDMVQIIELQPATIQAFHDRVSSAESGSDVSQRLAEIVARMNAVMASTGDAFTVPQITTSDDVLFFAPLLHNSRRELSPFVTPGATRQEAARQLDEMAFVCRYIIAASNMAAFYARRDKTFWAYEPAVKPGPGTVLLDATADLGPIVSFLPGVKRSAPISVDYSNLEVVHVEMPKQFQNVKRTLSKAQTAKEYAAWIWKVIDATTKPGDHALIVAHKALFDHEYLSHAPHREQPLSHQGRLLNTAHWGSGIGSNEWKDCTVVIEIGEWYQPRGVTISEVQGYKGQPITDRKLKLAVGRKSSDGDYQPKGDYRSALENHLIRWSKQKGSRGNVRNFDAAGLCGRMRLVSTMPYTRLTKNLDRMFPGTDTPKSITVPTGDTEPSTTVNTGGGRDRLLRLLVASERDIYSSQEVATLTGLKADHLKRQFNSDKISAVAARLGWTIASNRRVGKPGKALNLVRLSWLAEHGAAV